MRTAVALSLGVVSLAGCEGGPEPAAAQSAPARLSAPPPGAAAPSTVGMVLIPAGDFLQGAAAARPEEGPPRSTRVGAFWIDRTEVTNAEFARFVAATG